MNSRPSYGALLRTGEQCVLRRENRKLQRRSPYSPLHQFTRRTGIRSASHREQPMEKIAAKLGAGLYVCWGLLHFTAAYGVFKLAQNSPATMAQGRLMQTAFYLAAFATAAIVLAITLNWYNNRLGFWSNAV